MVFVFVLRVAALLLDCKMFTCQCSIFVVVSFPVFESVRSRMGFNQQLTLKSSEAIFIYIFFIIIIIPTVFFVRLFFNLSPLDFGTSVLTLGRYDGFSSPM